MTWDVALILGIDGLAIVCHGGSNGHALRNAILAAVRYADKGLTRRVAEALHLFGNEEDGHKRRRFNGLLVMTSPIMIR